MNERQQQQRKEKEYFWRPHVLAWKDSGLSATRYCAERSISVIQFRYWQYQLAPSTKRAAVPAQETSFTEVPTNHSLLQSLPYIELHTPNGYYLKFSADINPKQIEIFLNVIRVILC